MLEFSSRIGFRVHVTDLLHLQAALEADGIVHAAPDEENIMGIGELGGKPLDPLLFLEKSLDLTGQLLDISDKGAVLFLGDIAADSSYFNGEQVSRYELCGIGLGRRHRDLGACQGIEDIFSLSGDRRTDDIDDAQGPRSPLLGLAQGGQRIRCLTGLTDDNDQCIVAQDRIAVTEFASQFHADGNTGKILDHILKSNPDMVGTAAGNDIDIAEITDLLFCQGNILQADFSVLDDGVDGILDSLGLLVDLLHHEMLKTALFGSFRIPLDLGQFLGDLFLIQIIELCGACSESADLVVADIIDVSGVAQDRGNIGGDIGLVLPDADDHGAVLTGNENLIGIILEHEGQGIGAAHADHCAHDGIDRAHVVFFQVIVDCLDGDFRIRL